MKIWVVTALFPTEGEPYRGAAIWSTLRELAFYADIEGYCALTRYLSWLRPRNFRYLPQQAETKFYGIASRTIEYFAIPWVTRAVNGRNLYGRLRQCVPSEPPDLILGFYIYPEAYAAVRLGEALGVPVVIGSRGSDLRRIESNPFIQKMTRSALTKAAAVLCVSDDLAEVARRLGARPENVHTIRNGVDGDVFRPSGQEAARAALQLQLDGRLVLFVGWLAALKGVPQLLDAIALLNRGGAENWQLVLIGEGSLESDLRRQTRELGIQGRVIFTGPQNSRQIATWMNASDFLCLPSDSEGCPNVVVEALSCGTPVVANAVGGIPELVNERSAVLMPNNTAPAIARALEEARLKSWDRKEIARANSRSWQQVARETYRICEEVVGKWSPMPVQMAESGYGTRG
jgi:glycosyltransferase involved in cell wall biosynthesis